VGFEPTRPFGLPVFKTGAINHSTTPPGAGVRCGRANQYSNAPSLQGNILRVMEKWSNGWLEW
jgi:hypothetical protein